VPQHQVSELSKSLPSLGSSAQRGSSSRGVAESLVRDLALLLNLPDTGNTNTLAGQSAAVQRLQYAAHDLPKVLSGPLLELLIAHQQDGGVTDAAGARQQQQRLRAFVSALEAELPRMAASTAPESGSSGSSAWATAGSAGVPAAAAEGLLELLGPEESAELLADAAAKPRRQGSDDEDEESAGLYEMLADVHADVDMQRYLQVGCRCGCPGVCCCVAWSSGVAGRAAQEVDLLPLRTCSAMQAAVVVCVCIVQG
jgi:hypothetical protein